MWCDVMLFFLQANFPSLESLVAKIHEDREVAEKALDLPSYAKFKDDPYLTKWLKIILCKESKTLVFLTFLIMNLIL